MYLCTRCFNEQEPSQFSSWPRNKWCKECAAEYQRELRMRKPNYKGSGRNKALAAMSDEDRLKHTVFTVMLNDINARTRKYKLPAHDLTVESLSTLFDKQEGLCSITKLPMSFETGSPWKVSPDQTTAGAGYMSSNLSLTCWSANRAKGDLSNEDFLILCKAVVSLAQD